ncbi:MAG: hypothetical protein MJE63_05100 [Proteobacteria bacterium]|nr:hypothetical protein [Pseudomonadota bacterium]
MKWDQIIPDIKIITADEAKATLHTVNSSGIQLVDVRQIKEYNINHLPGAIPLPLVTLTDGRAHLNKQKPILLYSQTGNRALMAARWLHSHNFEDVAVIRGGIETWTGLKAFGHFDLNLNLLLPEADFPDAVTLAYAMEEGLRQFYIQLAKETDDELYKDLYRELAQYEVLHMQKLARKYHIELGHTPIQKAENRFQGQLTEGGGFLNMSLIRSLVHMNNISKVYSLSLAFETQALDFYYRLSMQAENTEVKHFFEEMADSERVHLAYVSKKLDDYLENNL